MSSIMKRVWRGLLGGKKDAAPADVAKKVAKPAPRAQKKPVNAKAGVAAADAPASKAGQNLAAASSMMSHSLTEVISLSKDLPSYQKILTAAGGEFELPESQRVDYALLVVKQSVLLLLVADEAASKARMVYLGILERARKKGYRVVMRLATRSVIRIVYDEVEEKRANKDDVDIEGFEADFDKILKNGLERNASDIHIEVRRTEANIRMRVNGVLLHFQQLSVRYAMDLAQVVYSVIAEEKDVTFNPNITQDAVIDREVGGRRTRVRLATLPAYPDGFDMTMRLLPIGTSTGRPKSLQELGYSDVHAQSIKMAIARPVGVTIFAGTTGSGKSTSLQNILRQKVEANQGLIKVITVEDPPEYAIPGATQVPVVRSKTKDSGENPFASAIRASMRSDPDILMVGEVRDPASSGLLVSAVQSGHQVFTTVHASSAFGIIARLEGLKVDRSVLAGSDFISGLVYQTLLPILCDHCSTPLKQEMSTFYGDEESRGLLSRLSQVCQVQNHNIRLKGPGCKHCTSGVVGRTVVAEVVVPDNEILRFIREGNDTDARLHWQKTGGRTALSHGIDKMLLGMVDPRDVEHKLGLLITDVITDGKASASRAQRT